MVLDKEKLDAHNFMNVILKETNFKHHNLDVAIHALKLPFFFDKDEREFYRFEGYIYHYNYEPMFRNFSVDINFGLKIKTKFLMSIFMNLSIEDKLASKNFTIFNSFLLKNGFSVNIKPNAVLGNVSDNVWHSISHMNKFNRILNSNFYEIDMFISSFNAHCIDDANANMLPIVDSRSRNVSFHLMSMDTFTVFSHKYYTEYRYMQRLSKLIMPIKAQQFFIKAKNDKLYFMLYDDMYSSLNNFFVKNINSLSYYTYIFKLYFFDSKGFFNNILKYSLHNNNSLLFFYMTIFNQFYTYFVSFKSKYNFNSLLSKKLKFLIFFNDYCNKSLNTNSLLLKAEQKNIKTHFYKLLHRHTKPKMVEHTVHHSYNIRNLPASVFTAISRFPYQPTGIRYTNNYINYKSFSYKEKGIYQYHKHLYVFYNVVFSFFKRNLVKGILNNNLLNPKFLISKFFGLFKYYKLYLTRDKVQSRFKKFIYKNRYKKKLVVVDKKFYKFKNNLLKITGTVYIRNGKLYKLCSEYLGKFKNIIDSKKSRKINSKRRALTINRNNIKKFHKVGNKYWMRSHSRFNNKHGIRSNNKIRIKKIYKVNNKSVYLVKKKLYRFKKNLRKANGIYYIYNGALYKIQKTESRKRILSLLLKRRAYLLLNFFVGNNLRLNNNFRHVVYNNLRKSMSYKLFDVISKIKKIVRRSRVNPRFLLKNVNKLAKLKALTMFIINKKADIAKRRSYLIKLKKSKLKENPLYYYTNLNGNFIWYNVLNKHKNANIFLKSFRNARLFKNFSLTQKFLKNKELVANKTYWNFTHNRTKDWCIKYRSYLYRGFTRNLKPYEPTPFYGVTTHYFKNIFKKRKNTYNPNYNKKGNFQSSRYFKGNYNNRYNRNKNYQPNKRYNQNKPFIKNTNYSNKQYKKYNQNKDFIKDVNYPNKQHKKQNQNMRKI